MLSRVDGKMVVEDEDPLLLKNTCHDIERIAIRALVQPIQKSKLLGQIRIALRLEIKTEVSRKIGHLRPAFAGRSRSRQHDRNGQTNEYQD